MPETLFLALMFLLVVFCLLFCVWVCHRQTEEMSLTIALILLALAVIVARWFGL